MLAFHDSRNPAYRSPAGAVAVGTPVTLTLDVSGAPGASAVLRTWVDGAGEGLLDMQPVPAASGMSARLDALGMPVGASDAPESASGSSSDAPGSLSGGVPGDMPAGWRAGETQRFQVSIAPAEEGVVWYQFVVSDGEGHVMRYGAKPGRIGGIGELVGWEPPSFQLTACEPGSAAAWALGALGERPFERSVVRFLREDATAEDLLETVEAVGEACPAPAAAAACDLLAPEGAGRLFAQLGGADAADPAALDEWSRGRAKDRLWRASLVQAFMPSALGGHCAGVAGTADAGEASRAGDAAADAGVSADASAVDAAAAFQAQDAAGVVAAWRALDADCGDIVQNASELQAALPLFREGEGCSFAANASVFGHLWEGHDGTAACILVNASSREAFDVLVPMSEEAASDLLEGFAVRIVEAGELGPQERAAMTGLTSAQPRPLLARRFAKASRYACVHVREQGSAVVYFHPRRRLERDMQPGLGVLAHITSLPADEPQAQDAPEQPEGAQPRAATLGAPALRFVDWLQAAGVRYWQVLPVNPTDEFGSPYAGVSAFAGNARLLDAAPGAAQAADAAPDGYRGFCQREAEWLEPYAAFMAIRAKLASGRAWQEWPERYHAYDPAALRADGELAAAAEQVRREQFAFELQWRELRAYANARGVQVVGDMPIYVSADSADAWANPELFQLGADGRPALVAGCPPDRFATEGQVWGNPVYDWRAMEQDGFSWWMRRLGRAFSLYDVVRLDHFIGFARYFSIPAGETALAGAYRPGPGLAFFRQAHERFGALPIIAEDLGTITPVVRALVAACGFPGMDIVQFADGDPLGGYAPRPEKIVYSGTHDNQTLVGFAQERYPGADPHAQAARLAHAVATCPAPVCVFQLQDVLGLGDEARMNMPGTAEGNWRWQAAPGSLAGSLEAARRLAELHAGA